MRIPTRQGRAGGGVMRQGLHTVAVRAVTLVCRAMLLVVVARTLSPAEYGVYALIGTIGVFGTVLLGLNLYIYVYRSVPGLAAAAQRKVFKSTSATELTLALGVVGVVIATGGLRPLAALLNAPGYELLFALGLFQVVLLVAISEATHYLLALARIEDSNWVDLLAQGAWVFVPVALWAAGLQVGLGTLVVMQTAGLAAAVAFAASRIGVRSWWDERVDRSTVRRALQFSLPMIVPALSVYVLKLADRPMLSHYASLADVGVYAFAFAIVNTLYSFTAGVVFSTLVPRVIAAHNAGDLRQRDALQTFMLKGAVLAFVVPAGAVFLLARPLLLLVAREEYLAAAGVMPLVGVAFLLIILAYPAHSLLTMGDRVKTLALIELVGMGCGLTGNLLLIPQFSYWGAAIASAVGFAVTLLLKWIASGMVGALRMDVLFTFRDERAAIVQCVRHVRGLRPFASGAAGRIVLGDQDR